MAEQSQLKNGKTLLVVLQFLLPVILAAIGGYGAVRYASGETAQKLIELERRVAENSKMIEKMDEDAVTSREMSQYMKTTESNFTDIKEELREIRNERRK